MQKESVSHTVRARDQLRQRIIKGEIRPNEQLVAADVAASLQISRTPVREALQWLAAEGLVVEGRRGYLVREHSADDIREIYEVRAALEGMAARLIVERATDEQIEAIERVGAHDEALADGAHVKLSAANELFHQRLAEASGNDTLCRINNYNSAGYFNYRLVEFYSVEEALASIRDHQQIIRALRRRDLEGAETTARDHVLRAIPVSLRKLRLV